MKKPLVLFLVIFFGAFCFFACPLLQELRVNAAIAKSPGVALAAPVSATKMRTHLYKIRYFYQVAGTIYEFDGGNESINKKQAAAVRTMPKIKVVYDTRAPAVAVRKWQYEMHLAGVTVADALLVSAGLALVISFAAALALSYKLGWVGSAAPRKGGSARSRRSRRRK